MILLRGGLFGCFRKWSLHLRSRTTWCIAQNARACRGSALFATGCFAKRRSNRHIPVMDCDRRARQSRPAIRQSFVGLDMESFSLNYAMVEGREWRRGGGFTAGVKRRNQRDCSGSSPSFGRIPRCGHLRQTFSLRTKKAPCTRGRRHLHPRQRHLKNAGDARVRTLKHPAPIHYPRLEKTINHSFGVTN